MNIARLGAFLLIGAAACGGAASSDNSERTPAAEVLPSASGSDSAHPDSAASGPGARSAATPRALRLATWNLAWLHRRPGTGPVGRSEADYARLREYVERLDADVIAFQEVDGVEAAQRVFDPRRYDVYAAGQTHSQRTGFAFKRGLSVAINPDYAALDVGQLRVGADITVEHAGRPVRLLSVHLKSGCFDGPLGGTQKDCRKLAAQLPSLEAWIDERAEEGIAAIVLGDFNRRLFGHGEDPFWREIDDSEPPDSDLWSPTEGEQSRCWGGEYPDYIDHLVLNRRARALYVQGSFGQLLYDAKDAEHKRVLSDHCPLSLVLDGRGEQTGQEAAAAPRAPEPANAASEQRVKGNLGAGRRKLYHVPGCPEYARTQIDEEKGERWFQSEQEAEAAGFVRASNCPAR